MVDWGGWLDKVVKKLDTIENMKKMNTLEDMMKKLPIHSTLNPHQWATAIEAVAAMSTTWKKQAGAVEGLEIVSTP